MAIAVQELVGGVHRGHVLGPGAQGGQEGLDGFRRPLGPAQLQHGGGVERPGVTRLEADGQKGLALLEGFHGQRRKRRAQLGGQVPGHAPVGLGITPVGGDVHVQDLGPVHGLDPVHGEAQARQELAELGHGDAFKGGEFLPECAEFDEHQSSPPMFLRNLWSFSKKRRRSGVWLTIIAVRSTPMPNAKPLHTAGSMPA